MKLKVEMPLDKGFRPLALEVRRMKAETKGSNGQDLIIGVERTGGATFVYKTRIFKDGSGHDRRNAKYAERIAKSILWVAGGFRIIVAGSEKVGNYIKKAYTKKGLRSFDVGFFETVYERPFEVVSVSLKDAPKEKKVAGSIGRHLDGCRIGFDAGGSDRKVSAVVNGESVYSEEVVWHPKLQEDPAYHFDGIYDAFRTAASKMPRVDAIGVSTAGVIIDNKPMVSSLFIKVPEELKKKYVQPIYIECAKKLSKELGHDIPVEVANDGDVTALAGSMDLGAEGVLGVAMGTSEAGGYVDTDGNVTGQINELAFVPVDYNGKSMVDEWSGDYGCGVKYFSQDAVIKLAPEAGITLDPSKTPAEKLKAVQKLMSENDPAAAKIFETIGIYFGYTIGYYAEFYDINHVLIMGRVTSGKGGELILAKAGEVLKKEFPKLYKKITLHIPDEKSRRVGQSAAAASLPLIKN
ncbi:MAG: ROK family protein [Clostridia bacterium]|nr:ROK family protein [Clostridia bacterium]